MNITTYNSAHDDAAWRDMSHFGRFHFTGVDAAALLHHLTTNEVKKLRAGQGNDTALVTSKGRLLDITTIYRQDEAAGGGLLVLTSPNRREMFKPHASKFILYRQDIHIEDVTAKGAFFGLFGPNAAAVLAPLSDAIAEAPLNAPVQVQIEGELAWVARTARLPYVTGFFVWSDSPALRGWVEKSGKPQADGDTYNVLRVEAGIPAAGFEITDEINPWEANLSAMISLHKGCYNGQEVIARLNTYKKIKQNLRGLKLVAPIPMGERCTIMAGGRKAGFVTSSIESPRFGAIGLGYVRNAHKETGNSVEVLRGENSETVEEATVADLPFGEVGGVS